jgi:DNA-binding transcriptional regulator LsrR (DeoR family)
MPDVIQNNGLATRRLLTNRETRLQIYGHYLTHRHATRKEIAREYTMNRDTLSRLIKRESAAAAKTVK